MCCYRSRLVFRSRSAEISFSMFQPVQAEEVASPISSFPNKQCRSDPLPTWLLKECSAELTLFICRLCHCERVVFHSRSIRRTSHHCSKKLVSTTATRRTTDLSPTCRSCQSCCKVSSCGGFSSISSPTACYPVLSPIPEIPLHRNCAREGIIGYLDGTWPRQRGGSGPSEPVRRVRHSR